ncbi:MAG TPA: DUF3024 domain-containing protein [Thermoanaerobaculia bacterium]|nr:DUF3024 domain-containing protein [Thermoanaerobaculia bacterium]
MPIPNDIRARAEAQLAEFCKQHSAGPGNERPEYTYTVEANAVVLVEQRPGFLNANDRTARPIARFRYSEARDTWTVYWRDSANKWERVTNVPANKDIGVLLQVVVTDPTGVFWS